MGKVAKVAEEVAERDKPKPKDRNVDGIFAMAEKGSTLDQAFQEKLAGDDTKWELYKANWKKHMGDWRAMETWYQRYRKERT